MIRVRTTPRPKNFRSRRIAKRTPRIIAMITELAVMTTERSSELRKPALVKTDV